MTRSPFGTHLTNVEWQYTARQGQSHKARLNAAMRDARERFPNAHGINAHYPIFGGDPADPITVNVSVRTSDLPGLTSVEPSPIINS